MMKNNLKKEIYLDSSSSDYNSDSSENEELSEKNIKDIMDVVHKKVETEISKPKEQISSEFKNSKVFSFKNYRDYKEHREKIVKIDFDLDEFIATSEINPKNRTAIIVPYRDTPDKVRSEQMKVFLEHYHNFLPNLKIYIVEQSGYDKKFNRGKLLNIGYKISKKDGAQVYITHDIDLISPKEMAPLYNLIPDHPVRIANLYKEKFFSDIFGGIVSYNSNDYIKSNGFPNNFWGWGGEDDAQYNRLVINDIPVYIPHSKTLKIVGLEHESMSSNPETTNTDKQYNILKDFKYWQKNGVNNVKFKLLKITKTPYKNAKIYSVQI